jgi:hypothetical protein
MTPLTEALGGDLVGWEGLTGDLSPAALEAELGVRWTAEPAPRQRASSAFTCLHGKRADVPQELDAWMRVGDSEVTTIEFRPPALLDHTAVLDDLGDPELVLPSNHFEVGSAVQEHVHAERGITVAVAEPFSDDGDARYIVYVQLYRPMSTQEFVTTVGPSGERLRPYPRPPGQ